MRLRNIFLLVIAIFCIYGKGYAIDNYFPYGQFSLRLSPPEEAIPGFGEYYSAVASGNKSSLWNPAGLGKLNVSEYFFSTIYAGQNNTYTKDLTLDEFGGETEIGAGGGTKSPINYAIFFRSYSAITGIGLTTKEVDVRSSLNASAAGSGANFSIAQRLNDWLVIGFSSRNPLDGDFYVAGEFPSAARAGINLYGKNFGEMQITAAGKLKYAFNNGGVVTTLETAGNIWDSFLSQEVTIPVNSISEFRDNINVQAPYVGTIASRFGGLYTGLNFIPISATATINNDVRAVVNSDVPNQQIYVPNFDPTDQAASAAWFLDQNKYGASGGYSQKEILLPTGQIVADAKYSGFYSGATARADLGLMYDLNDWVTFGFTMENFGGAELKMRGSGLAGYINYRNYNSAEAGTLLEPGADSSWSPIMDTWTTTFEVGGVSLLPEAEKNYSLPKKTRLGVALRRPFLIAIDYEQNYTPINFQTTDSTPTTVSISGLKTLRLGIETKVFTLPCLLRSGVALLFKPDITGDQATADTINKFFKFGVLPSRFDLGLSANFWGYDIGGAVGVNGNPIINILQVDTTGADLNEIAFYTLTLGKDAWLINYSSLVDAVASYTAYNNKPAANRKFEMSDIKFVNTLGVTYKF